MISIRTEKAIKAWLKIDKGLRDVTADAKEGTIRLHLVDNFDAIATFTIASIVKKRYPKRKKVKK